MLVKNDRELKVNEPYTSPRSEEEVERLLMSEVVEHPNFIFAAVRGNYGKEIIPMYNYVVVIEVPKEIRSQRVRNRSFQKFGKRMQMGGDLHEQEEAFFRMACFLQDLFGKKCRTFWRILHLQIGENCRGTGRPFFTDRIPVQA